MTTHVWNFGQVTHVGKTEVEPTGLAVLVPGLFPLRPRFDGYHGLLDCLAEAMTTRHASVEMLPFDYRATYWSPADLDQLAGSLAERIADLSARRPNAEIVLAAHSFGGLILRRALILATAKGWLARVRRVLLLASTSRGLLPATRWQRALIWGGRGAGEWSFLDRYGLSQLRVGRLALAGLKPSPWLTKLAADWRELLPALPSVVQLLAENDRIVELADDDDLAGNANFRQRIIARAGHRYFMLKRLWFEQGDAELRDTLEQARDAIRGAVG